MVATSKLQILLQDARFGVRMLKKSPGFTILALLTLALGIGANAAIFSVFNVILLHPLPIRDPQRVVVLHDQFPSWDMPRTSVSALQVVEFGQRTDLFESSGAVQALDLNLVDQDHSLRLQAMEITAGFLPVLGIKPYLGRSFSDADTNFESMLVTRGGEGGAGRRVTILSHKLWKRLFDGNAGIIGKTVQLEGHPYEIIGVLPEQLEILYPQTDLWVPSAFSPNQLTEDHRWYVGYTMLARLRSGVPLEQAQAGLTTVAARFNKEDFMFGVEVRPLIEEEVGDVRAPLSILLGAVGLVLLIACINIANLLLARNSFRSRELVIRAVLGADHGRIFSQLITESLILALVGGLLGLVFAKGCLYALVRLAPADLPHVSMIRLDPTVLSFTLIVSVLVGVLFGLAPALLSARAELSEALKEGSHKGVRTRRLRSVLVISEVALAVVLLVSSGLLLRSFAKLLEVRPGFDADKVLTMKLSLSQAMGVNPERMPQFSNAVLNRILALPGVLNAAMSTGTPFAAPGYNTTFEIRDRHSAPDDPTPHAAVMYTTPNYFKTLRIPLIKGRYYTPAEMRSGNAAGNGAVRVIDEALAKRFWSGRDPIGAQIGNDDQWATIIGVVGTVRDSDLSMESTGTIYLPGYGGTTLVVRTGSDPQPLFRAVREEVRKVSPDVPTYDEQTMSDLVATSLQRRRFSATLLALFAALAVFLAFTGLYGVITQIVSQRTYEIGIRMALGAHRRDVLLLVLWQGLTMTLLGVAFGLGCAFFVKPIIESQLFGVSTLDIFTLTCVSLLLIFVSLAACYVPARRATSIDPLLALRYE
jgi:predicted permease